MDMDFETEVTYESLADAREALFNKVRGYRQMIKDDPTKEVDRGTIITYTNESGYIQILSNGEILGWVPYIPFEMGSVWGE